MKKISSNSGRRAAAVSSALPVDTSLFVPGDRISIAVSGGADSTALLRTLVAQQAELGIVLHVLHVEHGLRGESAARDAAFVSALAEQFHLPCDVVAVDTRVRAAEGKESIEEAARNLRYQVFRDFLASGRADKIATAHTLDDQAETVLMKLLRGAWTEGLSGIHPLLRLETPAAGQRPQACIRPLLEVTRAQVEAYLAGLGQSWREDESNRSLAHTRNRVRHELLPALRQYNPQIDRALAHIAANARAEEQHWQTELARVLPQLLLPGKPVRGGGRSVATAPGTVSLALEIARLQALDAGLRRRVLRAAAERCGATLDFDATESLFHMAAARPNAAHSGRAARRLELPGGVRVERSPRELRFERTPAQPPDEEPAPPYPLPVPGEIEAPAFGARYVATLEHADAASATLPAACVRAWRPGDQVELAHSRGPRKVKEVLERMGIRGRERALWPVVVWQGRIVWIRGAEVAATPTKSDEAAADSGSPTASGLRLTICEIKT